jgi:hypothetical protein
MGIFSENVFKKPLSEVEIRAAEWIGLNPGATLDEIAIRYKRPIEWIADLYEREDFVQLIEHRQRIEQQAAQAVAEMGVADIGERFNGEILNNLHTLIAIRDDSGETAGNRLKATQMIMDYAPNAKRQTEKDIQMPNIVINIPYQQVQTIKDTAREIGMEFDLLEECGS